MRLCVEEIVTDVINNMFIAFIIVLYQYHGDGTRGHNQIEEIILMIIQRMQQRSFYEDSLKVIKILLGYLIPNEGRSLLEKLGES